MRGKSNLDRAKAKKNDEFYTQMSDIENELQHYIHHFEGKIIYCNCDDPKLSNFWKYFYNNFQKLKLKKLIATYYTKQKYSYSYECFIKNNEFVTLKRKLKTNGDFSSNECLEYLSLADIVVTNPPFSLFRLFINKIVLYNKKFLIIGNMNAVSYKEIFSLIKDNLIWLGINTPKNFIEKYKIEENQIKILKTKTFGNIVWFTNLEHFKRCKYIKLTKKYNNIDYYKYDNYDAINVNKTNDIPFDYYQKIGVPISFINKYNPSQFEIIGMLQGTNDNKIFFGYPLHNNKKIYARIIIKRK